MITIRDMELEAQRGCNIFDAADQLRDYVYQRSEEAFGRARRSFPDRESVEKHAREVRSRFLEAIGGIPDAGYRKRKERDGGCPDRVTGVISCGDYSIEKVIFASAEHVLVSANLYLPAGCRQDLAAVLLVCGHDPEGKQAAEYQRACIRLVQAGLAVLVMDSFGQGERASYYDAEAGTERVGRCTREHDYAGFPCMLAGDSAARYLIRDACAAVDYLETRPEIDASRIGITGNSGGGTLTLMTMLADPRLKAAAPGTFVTSRKAYLRSGQAQDNEQIWQGLTEAGIDHADILMCLAPKPVLLLTAAHDFFPQKGTESTFEICSRIGRMYGRPEDLEVYRDDCMHTYSAGMAERAAEFFARRLKKEPGAEDKLSGGTKERRLRPAAAAEGIRLQPSAVLWCTKTGHLQTETGTESIFEQNRRRCLELIRERNARMTEEGKAEGDGPVPAGDDPEEPPSRKAVSQKGAENGMRAGSVLRQLYLGSAGRRDQPWLSVLPEKGKASCDRRALAAGLQEPDGALRLDPPDLCRRAGCPGPGYHRNGNAGAETVSVLDAGRGLLRSQIQAERGSGMAGRQPDGAWLF